ncbi:MAG: hypothetical protein K9M56_03500 [Victivallales bacterium]|nr:hypothetical protein [Victivallales bacterium]
MKLPKLNFSFPKFNKELIFKIINIFSLILAVTAIILSIMLFKKRKELFDSNKKMATAINRTAAILDKKSGTENADIITVSAARNSYKNQTPLTKLQAQASEIIKQRNLLGDTLKKIAKYTPDAKSIEQKDFTNTKSYSVSTKELLKSVDDLDKLHKAIPGFIKELASSLKVELKNTDELKTNPRRDKYKAVFKTLSADAENLNRKLSQNKKELTAAKNQLGKTKIKLNKFKDLDADYKALIKSKESQNNALLHKTKKLQNRINSYKNKIRELRSSKKKQAELKQKVLDYNTLLQKVHGEVKKYDSKWGNVIINIGKNTEVTTKIKGKEKKVKVSIPINSELIVARNDKFVARIKIKKVYDNYSLAVLSFPKNASIKPGDFVFFPSITDYENNNMQKNIVDQEKEKNANSGK